MAPPRCFALCTFTKNPAGFLATALICDFEAEAQPWRLNLVPRAMKTGPAAPALPLWMCAAFPAPSIFEILNSQQTLPVAGLSVISTEPLFEAGDFGTSFAPLSWAFRWLPPLAAAIPANMTPVAMAVTSTAIANVPFRINPPLAWFRPVVRREGGFGFPTLDARCGSSIGSESQRGSAPGRRLPPRAGSHDGAPERSRRS